LLQLQLHKKSDQVEAPSPRLETPEQIKQSVERDQALIVRAQREQEESAAVSSRVAAKRDRFELTRDQIRFAFELIGVVVALIVLLVLSVTSPQLIPFTLLSGAGLGGIGAALRKRS
jgi:hypothetical protein